MYGGNRRAHIRILRTLCRRHVFAAALIFLFGSPHALAQEPSKPGRMGTAHAIRSARWETLFEL